MGPVVVRMSCCNWCLWAALGCAGGDGNALPPSADEAPFQTHAPSAGNGRNANSSVAPEQHIERQIQLLERILADGDGAEHGQVHLNLADAYLSRVSQATVRSRELDARRFDATKEQRSDLDRRYAQLTEQQERWLAEAITSFEALLAESGPASSKLHAAARLGLADALEMAGRQEERNEMLTALVRDAPEHPFAGVALAQLGDQAFANAKLMEAQVLYERAVTVSSRGNRLYAEYKLGWIALNLGEGVLALETWERVVRDGRLSSEHRALADAAAHDCVMAFATVGLPAEARAFFRRLHPELAPALLLQLAQRYRDEGRDADAMVAMGVRPPPDGPR